MTAPTPDPGSFRMLRVAPPRWLRPALAGYVLLELVVLVLFARRVGLPATLVVLAISALIGLFQLSRLPRRVGERGLDVLSAVLFIVPGLLSTVLALLLTLPGIRRLVRSAMGARMQRWTSTAAARQVVVRGSVISDSHDAERPDAPSGTGSPKMIEGVVLDRHTSDSPPDDEQGPPSRTG